jgi:hypothetical protein
MGQRLERSARRGNRILNRNGRSGSDVTDGQGPCHQRQDFGNTGGRVADRSGNRSRIPRQNPCDSTRISHKLTVQDRTPRVARPTPQRTNTYEVKEKRSPGRPPCRSAIFWGNLLNRRRVSQQRGRLSAAPFSWHGGIRGWEQFSKPRMERLEPAVMPPPLPSLELNVWNRVEAHAGRTRDAGIPTPHKTIPRLSGLVGARIERAVTC